MIEEYLKNKKRQLERDITTFNIEIARLKAALEHAEGMKQVLTEQCELVSAQIRTCS